MLGESNKQAELMDRARKQNVDVLFVFDIEVSAQGETVINKTKISVHNLAAGDRGEVVHGTKTLVNNSVNKAREGKGGEDPVAGEMNRLFEYLDENFSIKNLPETATAEKVDKFVSTYASKKFSDPMPVLAELKYYYDRKLITTERFGEIAKVAAGDEAGAAVASGNTDLILPALNKWLPEKRPKKIVVDDAGGGAAPGGGAGGFLNKLFGGGK